VNHATGAAGALGVLRRARRLSILGLLLCTPWAWCMCTGSALAQAAPTQLQVPAHSVKAAFLYKFLPFIEWPAQVFVQPDSPYVIGVVGGGALSEELAEVTHGRLVNGRPVVVRKLGDARNSGELHLLYLGSGSRAQIAATIAEAKTRNVVSVTDVPDGLALGSVINFVVVDGRVRFEIALDAAEETGVRVSARLLAVAHRVRGRKA
jgi:hypothetical protein